MLFAGSSALFAQSVSPFVSGVWCGNVTPTSATVCVRLNAEGMRVRLAVSTSDRLSPAVTSTVANSSAEAGNVVKLHIEGLSPATEYFYGIEVDGVLRTESGSRGRFRTFPQGAASFRLAFASCSDLRDPDHRAFDAIAAEQPHLFLHTGDLHYSDTDTGVAEDYRQNYNQVLNHPTQRVFYRNHAVAYMWDDHDFIGNDSTGGGPIAAVARSVYREYVPHYPILPGGGSIAQAFTIGRVRVIMTDLRSASSPLAMADTASKSRMGAAQKAWFKQELIGARDAGFPLILWVNTLPWIGAPQAGSDTWAGFATERTELANFFKENQVRNLVILSGDMHALAYDDGTNSDYAIGGGTPLIVLHAAALTRVGDAKGGPYTAGPVPGNLQYGLLDITDSGGSTVQCRFTGKRVGEGTKLVLQFSASVNGILTSSGPNSGGGDHAFLNISTRGRITNASDSLIACFVIGGARSRTILLRAVGPSLNAFGVGDAVSRPVITLYRGATIIGTNSGWTVADPAALITAFDRVGAFRFAGPTSADAAFLVTLEPGAYTMQASGLNGTTGTVLVEAYEVP